MTAATWTLGIKLGLPVAAMLLLVGLALLVTGIVMHLRSDGYDDDGPFVGAWGLGVIAVTLAVSAYAFWPYSAQYHQWRPVSGVVTDVNSRILRNGDSVDQKFVVQFTDGGEYGCTDTRCSLVKPGDRLDLSCKRIWQYSGRDGWDCNYVGRAA